MRSGAPRREDRHLVNNPMGGQRKVLPSGKPFKSSAVVVGRGIDLWSRQTDPPLLAYRTYVLMLVHTKIYVNGCAEQNCAEGAG